MPEQFTDVTAAVLVGGRGTRLQPVVADRPKAMAPVLGRPYLSYLLDFLADAGVRKVVLSTGHMADQIERAFGHTHAGLTLTYSEEPTALGTAGALRHAFPLYESSSVLILNGDSFWGIELEAFWKHHTTHGGQITIGVTWVPDASRYGRVHLRGDRVCGFDEKQPRQEAGWINTGMYLASRECIEEIPPDVPRSLERDMLPRWVEKGCCFGYRASGPFLDIGTPDSYAQAAEFFGSRQTA
jgi:D-glycero-alpha-D-manno-heptose 1-phosphate guanylyltransferase